MFPPDEFAARRAKMAALMEAQGVDLLVVTHAPDLYYLSGTVQASYVFLPRSGEPWLAARRGAARARTETDLAVEEFSDSASFLRMLQNRGHAEGKRLGLAFDVTSYEQIQRLGKLFGGAEMIDLGAALRGMRQQKSAMEIELIRKAGRQLDEAVGLAASCLREGLSELELAIRIESFLRSQGHPGVMRARRAVSDSGFGFILAGVSTLVDSEADMVCTGPGLSEAVPFGPSARAFQPGEPVLFDYCGCYAGYMADESRMLSLGPPPGGALQAYEAMRQVLRSLEHRLGPGEQAGALYELACAEAGRLGYGTHFMGSGRGQLKFVGHGIGLELDEQPFLAKNSQAVLAPGMMVAIEPKVSLPGLGVIGVENTYLITDKGWELLTLAGEEWRQVPMA